MIKYSSIRKLNLITIMFNRFILVSLLFWTFSSFGNDKRSINYYEWTYRLLLLILLKKLLLWINCENKKFFVNLKTEN